MDIVQGPYQYDPEFTWNYEISLRARLFDDRALLSANLYYIDWTDQQVLLEDAVTGGFFTDNAGTSELRGFELELKGYASDKLEYFANLGRSDTEFTDFVSSVGDFTGDEFPNAARWSFAAGLTYGSGSGFFASGNVNYRDEAFNDVPNLRRNDERILLNCRIGYDFAQSRLSLFARNLLDEEYITSNLARNNVVKVGEPRILGAEFQMAW